MFSKGDRVFVFAAYFDPPNSGNAWSKATSGDNWETEKCFGTLISIGKDSGRVKWDIDGNTTRVKLDDINLHQPSSVQPAPQLQAENFSALSVSTKGKYVYFTLITNLKNWGVFNVILSKLIL